MGFRRSNAFDFRLFDRNKLKWNSEFIFNLNFLLFFYFAYDAFNFLFKNRLFNHYGRMNVFLVACCLSKLDKVSWRFPFELLHLVPKTLSITRRQFLVNFLSQMPIEFLFKIFQFLKNSFNLFFFLWFNFSLNGYKYVGVKVFKIPIIIFDFSLKLISYTVNLCSKQEKGKSRFHVYNY